MLRSFTYFLQNVTRTLQSETTKDFQNAFVTVIVATFGDKSLQVTLLEPTTRVNNPNPNIYIHSACLITMMDSQTDGFYSFGPLCSGISKPILLFTCIENFILKLTISKTQWETGKA